MEKEFDLQTTDDSLYIFFINRRSGSQRAQTLLQQLNSQACDPALQVVDLSDQKELALYFEQLADRIQRESSTILRLIACGGDGTVSWLVSLIQQYHLPKQQLLLGIIPFGTGNDFAKHLGWQHLTSLSLKEIINCLNNTSVKRKIDLWKVCIEVDPEGHFEQNRQGENQVIVEQKVIERLFVNYLSFGMDARVSYEFERNRVSCACCNFCCYCLVGFKNFFLPIPKMGQLVNQFLLQGKPINFPQQNLHLLFQNINSYMGGVTDIWGHVRGRHPGFVPQRSDDGLLETLSFRNELSLGLERVCRGRPAAVSQGHGPFEVLFNESQRQTYLQMDGQNLKIVRPHKLTITRQDQKLSILAHSS